MGVLCGLNEHPLVGMTDIVGVGISQKFCHRPTTYPVTVTQPSTQQRQTRVEPCVLPSVGRPHCTRRHVFHLDGCFTAGIMSAALGVCVWYTACMRRLKQRAARVPLNSFDEGDARV